MRLKPLATALTLTLLLAACGGDDKPARACRRRAGAGRVGEPPAEAAQAELPPMPTGDFRITSVTLGKSVDDEGQVRQAAGHASRRRTRSTPPWSAWAAATA